MATREEAVDTNGYSSTVRKVVQVGSVGVILQTATEVGTTEGAIPATALTNRKTILIYNSGSNTVYLGATGVTTVDGYPLASGDEKAFDLVADGILYGITESGTSDIRTLEGS